MGKALTAIVLGAAGLATGVCLGNETARDLMEYVLNEDYVNVMANYAGLAQLCGAATVAAGIVGGVYNTLNPCKDKPQEKKEEKQE